MNYITYDGIFDANVRIVKKYCGGKNADEQVLRRSIITELYNIVRDTMQIDKRASTQMEYVTIMDEFRWIKEGRHILFPSKGLAEAMLSSKFEVDPNAFRLPFDSFSLAMPKGLVWKGVEIGPVFVERRTCAARQVFYDAMHDEYGLHRLYLDGDEISDTPTLRIVKTTPVVVNDVKAKMMNKIAIPNHLLNEIISKGGDPADDIRIVGNMSNTINCGQLTDKEREEMYWALKLVIGIGLFIQSFPNSMVDGLPKDITTSVQLPKHSRPHLVGREIMKDMQQPHTVGLYRRGFHFRSFPTRRDGTKHPGLVPVEAHWCGGKVSAHTIAGNVEENG
jgi:hypothetical protein